VQQSQGLASQAGCPGVVPRSGAQVWCPGRLPRSGEYVCLGRLGLACLGVAWRGLTWLDLAWLGLAWRGLALGTWLGLAWLDLTGSGRCLRLATSILTRRRGTTPAESGDWSLTRCTQLGTQRDLGWARALHSLDRGYTRSSRLASVGRSVTQRANVTGPGAARGVRARTWNGRNCKNGPRIFSAYRCTLSARRARGS